jgi:hypothetical protein
MVVRRAESWVVYWTPVKGNPGGANAVCEQAEWDRMEADRPGYHTLVRAGIANEGEAERLARGTSGDPVPRGPKPLPIVETLADGPPPAAEAATP